MGCCRSPRRYRRRSDRRQTPPLKKEFSSITLPVLILHGTGDQAAKPSGSQRFYDTAGSRDKRLKLYDGHFHDLLNDIDKEVVMADIKKLAYRPSPRVRRDCDSDDAGFNTIHRCRRRHGRDARVEG
jgi:alpha-beta hydrolase superfamily lysophospholipase